MSFITSETTPPPPSPVPSLIYNMTEKISSLWLAVSRQIYRLFLILYCSANNREHVRNFLEQSGIYANIWYRKILSSCSLSILREFSKILS